MNKRKPKHLKHPQQHLTDTNMTPAHRSMIQKGKQTLGPLAENCWMIACPKEMPLDTLFETINKFDDGHNIALCFEVKEDTPDFLMIKEILESHVRDRPSGGQIWAISGC